MVSPLLFCVFYLEPLLYGSCRGLKGGGSASPIRADKTTHTPYPPGLRDVGGRGLPVCLAGSDQTENSAEGEFCWWSGAFQWHTQSPEFDCQHPINNAWCTAVVQSLARLVGRTPVIIYLPLQQRNVPPTLSVYGCLGGAVVKDLPG